MQIKMIGTVMYNIVLTRTFDILKITLKLLCSNITLIISY